MRLPASASALGAGLASCWPRPQQLLPVSATGGGRRRCTSSVSGLTVTTMTVSPTKREPPFGAGTPGGGFLFLGMVNLTFGIPDLSIPDSPQKSSAVQKVYKHSSLSIYCIFLSKFMIYWFCGSSRPSYLGREVKPMIHILTILESAVANIISHYICKWLDRLDKDRKPD